MMDYSITMFPGYISSSHSGTSLPLQQQLEHANQKSGFSEEKFKLQQVKYEAILFYCQLCGSKELRRMSVWNSI